MSWKLDSYQPPSEEAIQRELRTAALGNRGAFTTAYHMYMIVVEGRDPVCSTTQDRALEWNEIGIRPGQARKAFAKKWVPERLVQTLAACAESDGKLFEDD
ncbi:MAG: hypothetical protein AAGE80_14975 [Pseudomonadota bacterium]